MLHPHSFSIIISWSCAKYMKVQSSDFQPPRETNSTKHLTSLDSFSFVQMHLGAREELIILINIDKHVNGVSNIRQKVCNILNCTSNDLLVID